MLNNKLFQQICSAVTRQHVRSEIFTIITG